MLTVLKEKIELKMIRSRGRFQLHLNGQVIEQTVCEFLLTFSFLKDQPLEDYLLNTDDDFDQVTIPLTGCGKTLRLELSDFVSFREVYFNEMFELKLEDLLLRQDILLSAA